MYVNGYFHHYQNDALVVMMLIAFEELSVYTLDGILIALCSVPQNGETPFDLTSEKEVKALLCDNTKSKKRR